MAAATPDNTLDGTVAVEHFWQKSQVQTAPVTYAPCGVPFVLCPHERRT